MTELGALSPHRLVNQVEVSVHSDSPNQPPPISFGEVIDSLFLLLGTAWTWRHRTKLTKEGESPPAQNMSNH